MVILSFCFRVNSHDEKVAMNEVFAHAALIKHKHVVRYYNSWVEKGQVGTGIYTNNKVQNLIPVLLVENLVRNKNQYWYQVPGPCLVWYQNSFDFP